MILLDHLLPQLHKHIQRVFPHEAVGLILPDETIVALTNRSPNPSDTFQIRGKDIADELTLRGLAISHEVLSNVTLWHSHPGGGIGPSRQDMQNKAKPMSHLILTPVDGELIASWY